MSCYTRRTLLKTGGLVAVSGLSGCLGISTERTSCDEAADILVRQTHEVDLTVPFDQPDKTYAVYDVLENQGYTTRVRVDYDHGGSETRTIEILGQIEVDEVRRLANEHELTVVSIESGTSGDTALSDIDSSWIWPWETPLLVDRVEEYQAAAEQLSVSIPTLSPTKTEISILDTQDKSLEAAIEHVRTAFEPSGQITVEFESSNLPASYDRDYAFKSSIGRDDFITRQIEYQSQGQQYEVRAQVKDNRYIRSMFGSAYHTKLPDSIVDGEMVIRMDGEIVQRRPPTELEQTYFTWYLEKYEKPTHLDDVPVTITDLSAQGAARIGSSLAVPTGSLNLFRQKC